MKTIGDSFNYCIENARKKDEIIFSIECDERRRLSPAPLNKKEFYKKSLDCTLTAYRKLLKMESESQWNYNERIQDFKQAYIEFMDIIIY